jgi:hypothetical protein
MTFVVCILLFLTVSVQVQAFCPAPLYRPLDFHTQDNYNWADSVSLPQDSQVHSGVPLQFSSDAKVWHGHADSGDQKVIIDVNLANVQEFYTAINTAAGFTPGNVASPTVAGRIVFVYSDASTVTYQLHGAYNIRSYSTSSGPATVIDNQVTPNIFTYGTTQVDMQVWHLPMDSWSKTLDRVEIIDDVAQIGTSSLAVFAATAAECLPTVKDTHGTVDYSASHNYDWDAKSFFLTNTPMNVAAGGLPTGSVTLGGVDFELGSERRVWVGATPPGDSASRTLELDIGGVTDVSHFYLLIGLWWGIDYTQYGTVKFDYADGSSYEYNLHGLLNMRDYNNANYNRPQRAYDPLTVQVYADNPSSGTRVDMQTIPLPTELAPLPLTKVSVIDTGAWGTSRLLVTGAAYDTVAYTSCLPSNASSCDYEPQAPQVSSATIGSNYLINITVVRDAFSNGVTVAFPSSDVSDPCAFYSEDPTHSQYWNAFSQGCDIRYELDIPVSTMLASCGFAQRTLSNAVLFLQTVAVHTNRSCDAVRETDVSVTRQSDFPISLSVNRNVTARTSGLEVFGNAFTLDLLGDLTIDFDIDTFVTTVSGAFVTSVQHPYELEFESASVDGEFDASSFSVSHPSCVADNSTRLPCQQTWDFSVNVSVSCEDGKRELDGDWLNLTFSLNCSEGFIGECAPDFAVDPQMVFALYSPDYCIQDDAIVLVSELQVYAYTGSNSDTPDFSDVNLATLPATNWESESIYTFDSIVYGEFTVSTGSTATLTGTKIIRITTQPSFAGQADIVVFDTATSTQEASVSIYDTSFGTTVQSNYADYRSRFEFKWTSSTVNLDSAIEDSQTIAIEVIGESTFTNVQHLEPVAGSPVLSQLARDTHEQTRRDVLMAETDTRSLGGQTIAGVVNSPATNPDSNSGSNGNDSESFVSQLGGSSVVIGGVAVVAIVAIVVAAVMRNRQPKPEANSTQANEQQVPVFTLPTSSSFDNTQTMGSTSYGVELQNVAFAYDTTTGAPFQTQ